MKQQIQPEHEEQPQEDAAQSQVQPEQEELPEAETVISWMMNIWRRISGNG
ncbi:hypothetical protein OAN307_c33750 [Octadecabacter antarcticus 307]|uniref:Uncharacterized protein n=1 Tax=Octadecabacter antarcticus 307 TaxID=391626 RepID=M9R873_9RHOB|nr:hypothetical protein [Octadecabacter antarcticus]AGI68879.1 hypothetical protein OAN307_c33750 [Octadecabacter antarcticus 307]